MTGLEGLTEGTEPDAVVVDLDDSDVSEKPHQATERRRVGAGEVGQVVDRPGTVGQLVDQAQGDGDPDRHRCDEVGPLPQLGHGIGRR